MTTFVMTLWRAYVTSLTTSVSTMRFLIEIKFILKAIKFNFKGPYDKQTLTLVITSHEIDETRRRLVSLISNEISTGIRFSITRNKNYTGKHSLHLSLKEMTLSEQWIFLN